MKMGSLQGLYVLKVKNCDFRQDFNGNNHENRHFTWDYMVLEEY